MKLDRELQRRILEILRDAFPGPADEAFDAIQALSDESTIDANLLYLDAHGLITAGMSRNSNGTYVTNINQFGITHHGLDFLQDDGGLSAILGVVTIKLHDDTIKALIEAKILASDLPPPDKQRFLARLRSLPADATKHVVMKLVDLGLDKSPDAISWLGKWLDNLPLS